jgi:two-component system LytT family sensor kinase
LTPTLAIDPHGGGYVRSGCFAPSRETFRHDNPRLRRAWSCFRSSAFQRRRGTSILAPHFDRMSATKSPRRDMSDVVNLTLAITLLWLLLHAANIAEVWVNRYVAGRPVIEHPTRAVERLLMATLVSALMTPLLIYLVRLIPRGERLGAAAWARFIGVVLAFAIVRAIIGEIAFGTLWDYPLTVHRFRGALFLQTHTHAVNAAIAGAFIVIYDSGQAGLERERLRAALTVSRLQQLRAQFRPHFLLNTLNTIATLVHREPKTADGLITSLASLLRWTLDLDEVDHIRLKEELEFVQHYLTIQQVRFGPRLEASIDAPPETLRCTVHPLVLQPLVENAIIHGLRNAHPKGHVRITAAIDGNALVLQVRDSGGADPSTVHRGVGLKNLEERLSAMYGERGTLAFRSEAGEFVAEVRIPTRSGKA